MTGYAQKFFAGFLLAVLLGGCTKEAVIEPPESVAEEREVTVVSNGITYRPFEYRLNGQGTEIGKTEKNRKTGEEEPVVSGGESLSPKEIMLDTTGEYHMPEVFYAEDFFIKVKGNGDNPIGYLLYDMAYERAESKKVMNPSDIVIPEDGKDYYVQLEFDQCGESDSSHYQYFFKVVRGEPLPQIKVTQEKKSREIPSASGVIIWNEPGEDGDTVSTTACGPEPFTVLAKETEDIPYLPLGRWITIELTGEKPPEEVVLSDYILRENGTPLYSEREVVKTELEYDQHEMRFCLSPNFSALLSSDMDTYMTGGVLRGFKLELAWEDGSSAEYGFVLFTDALYAAENSANQSDDQETDLFLDLKLADVEAYKKELVLEVNNQSQSPILFGSEVTLYRLDDAKLQEIPLKPEAGWKNIAYQVSPGSYKTFTVEIEALYGGLEPGSYRIKKAVKAVEGKSSSLYADFIVASTE